MDTNDESSNDEMDDADVDCYETPVKDSQYTVSEAYFVQQITPAQYDQQTREYTKDALQSLTSSPEYMRVYTRCQLCWCSWSDGSFCPNCAECGGFAMTRPCPICQGRCSAVWTRDVELSHSNMEAYWDGDCNLPSEERQGFLAQMLISTIPNQDEILEDFGDLTAQ